MTTTFDDDAALRELLRPLAHVRPVARKSSHRRPQLALALALLILAACGIAAAAGLNPFAGIGSADRPAATTDALDPAIQKMIQRFNAEGGRGAAGELLPDTARLLTQLDSGGKVYVLSTTTNALCVLVQQAPATGEGTTTACGYPLSQSQPTTELTERLNPQTPPLAVGVARDDVTAVSFIAGGIEKTVPVTNNVWVYEGESSIGRSLTIHFRDGTTTTIGHG
jgi:hypothetical protein